MDSEIMAPLVAPETYTGAEIAGAVAEARALPELPPRTAPTELPMPVDETGQPCTRWGTNREQMEVSEAKMLDAANRTPTVVKAALSPKDLKAAGRAFHRFNIQTYINLEEISSPFLPNAKKAEDGRIPMRDVMRTLWVMIENDEVVEQTLAQGAEAVRGAVLLLATEIPFSDLPALSEAIGIRIAEGFAPAAKLDPPKQEGGGAPLSVPSSATAPAGS